MVDFYPNTSERNTITAAPLGHRLLLIEDNMGDARLLQLMLEEADFVSREMVHCQNLTDGINSYDDDFDVVFLDLSLPDSRGFETLERFLMQHPNANIIVMTGFSDREMGIKAVKAGAQDFLVKGDYEVDKLVRTLYYSIERSNNLKRFDEAQRLAGIGSWELRLDSQEYFFSEDIYKILETPSLGKRFCYKDLPGYKDHVFYRFFTDIHKEVYHLYNQGNIKGIQKEYVIDGIKGKKTLLVRCYIPKFEGKNPVFYGILQDITEQREAAKLRQEKELSEESSKLKEEFITNVSHEMRTPMNAILGMSNILLGTTLSTEQNDCLKSIKQSSEVLLGIVNDILEISTLQKDKVSYERQEFNLHELMFNVVEVMQYKMAEKELAFELGLDVDVIPKIVVGDKLRLNQILFNLVGNAIKFTDRGHVKIKMKIINVDNGKTTLEFEVEDSGIGIPADKLEAIFDTFTRIRTKERLFEGTGLGLSIARKLIEQQNGRIWVTSEIGKGSTFYFTLPFDVAINQDEVVKDNGYGHLNVNPDHAFRLLLAEDNKLNQLVAKKTLEKQWKNITLVIAGDGQKAVEILQEQDFDIILMDIQMPIMDGYDATDFIRTNMPHRKHIPILAMTAFAHISQDDKFKQFGLDDFVLKPFDPDDLYYKVAIYTKNC